MACVLQVIDEFKCTQGPVNIQVTLDRSQEEWLLELFPRIPEIIGSRCSTVSLTCVILPYLVIGNVLTPTKGELPPFPSPTPLVFWQCLATAMCRRHHLLLPSEVSSPSSCGMGTIISNVSGGGPCHLCGRLCPDPRSARRVVEDGHGCLT